MAQTKDIKKKIGSVQNTKKITSAMELVASSKMKKTQDAMKKGKPYSQKIIELIDNLAGASSEYKHPFFKSTKQKTDQQEPVSRQDRALPLAGATCPG